MVTSEVHLNMTKNKYMSVRDNKYLQGNRFY